MEICRAVTATVVRGRTRRTWRITCFLDDAENSEAADLSLDRPRIQPIQAYIRWGDGARLLPKLAKQTTSSHQPQPP